jgi:hypothetical protein
MNTRLLFLILAFCLSTFTLSAQVLINEISAANMTGTIDGDGDREDWVELHNSGPVPVNLSGWFLSDDPANPQKWTFPNGINIAAGAYRVIYCSSKDKSVGGYLHTNFKITQTKDESAVLTRPNGVTADSFTYDVPNQGDHSYGRAPNGGSTWKIFTTPTPGAANNVASSYASYAPKVQASLQAGFYPGTIQVGLSTTPGFTIVYTTNGSEPTAGSTVYSGPINITATTILKARAYSSDPQVLIGFVLANTYFINVNHGVPVISIAGDALANLMNGSSSNPLGSFEYFENQSLEAEAYGEFNKHGNDSWAYPQRGIDWITRDQMGYKDVLKHKFFTERDRTKFQRLILKAGANDNYPTAGGAHVRDAYVHTLALRGGLDLDMRASRACVVYVNGQYWGVYDLREKADDADYTDYYYGQDEPYIDYIKTWGNTWQEYGSWNDWYILSDYILANNMGVAANYDYVDQRFDLLSLIDYVILNQHTVNKDWLNWNTAWWRGRDPNGTALKWRYALWDLDATFGHYINYTGIPNTGPGADPCDVEIIPNSGDPQNHIDIFMSLYANPKFKALYINRYADLLNTSLSCTYMNALLDNMTLEIEPEMAKHCARWGGTVNGWKQRVADLRSFINSRCQSLDQSIEDCYNVTGPYNLTVNVSPAGPPNQVTVNTITPTTYPFVGEYFGGVLVSLTAKPATGWVFDHWEVNGNTFTPGPQSAGIGLDFQTTGTATAFFVPTGPCLEPTGLAITDPLVSPTLAWTGLAGNYRIRYRKVGNPTWAEFTTTATSWKFDTLPGCSQYEMQIQSVCPQGNSAFVDFTFGTPNHLQGVTVADAQFCNAGNALLGTSVSGASYLWDDGSTTPTRSVSAPGKYWVTIQRKGCTLTDTVQVSQINSTANLQPVLCAGEVFMVGSETFDAQKPSGQAVLAGMGASGCDSVVNVALQILPKSQLDISKKNCDIAAVGIDTIFLKNAVGCDSLVVTTTTLAPVSQKLLSATSCNPALVGTDTLVLSNFYGCDSLVITTTVFDPAGVDFTYFSKKNCDVAAIGVDTVFLKNALGCDSLVVTTTTLAPVSQKLVSATSCNPALVGTDTLVLSNFYGCDSLVITTTVFDPAGVNFTYFSKKNCDIAAVGIDTIFLKNALGCDSLVVTTTTLAPVSQKLLSATSCNPALVGTDTLVLSNFYGCDSLVITTTAFDPAGVNFTYFSKKNCDVAAVGIDTVFLKNALGCDSLVVTTTTLAPVSQKLLSATSCNPALVGTDTLVLSNFYGCDSLVITTTAFDPAGVNFTYFSKKNCDVAAIGIDTAFLKNTLGCDSLVVTTTTLAPVSQKLLSTTSCNPALVGTDTLVLSNFYGCDSLVITTTAYNGLDFEAFSTENPCYGTADGLIRLDTVVTDWLPVSVQMGNRPVQSYTGSPLFWEGLSAGAYSVSATNAAGCTAVQDVDVTEAPALHLDFGQQPFVLHLGDSLWVEPTADFTVQTASWSPAAGVACVICPSTFIAARKTEKYTLTATDANGCSTTASVTIRVEDGVRVYVANAMHAGGENLTIFAGPDVSRIQSLRVYDRWGNNVFEQRGLLPNVPSAWDGTLGGKTVAQGVFLWVCKVETIDGREVVLEGDITLIK